MFDKLKEIKKGIKFQEKKFRKGVMYTILGILFTGLGILMPSIFVRILPNMLNVPETALVAVLTTVFGGFEVVYGIVSSIISRIKKRKLDRDMEEEIHDIEYQFDELKKQYNEAKEINNSYLNAKDHSNAIENSINLNQEVVQNDEKEYVKVKTR